LKALVCLVAAALLLGSETWPKETPSAPLVGFSYSPGNVSSAADPARELANLLAATEPDLVRLPVYWELVQPTPDSLDFSSVDELLDVIDAHNTYADRPARVVLTLGARNFLYPELHQPAWAGPREQPNLNEMQSSSPYRTYFDESVLRYRASPLLYAWQVENEPLDYVVNEVTGADQITTAQMAWEVDEVHSLDPAHKVGVTTFDGWNVYIDMLQIHAPMVLAGIGMYPSGHPAEALQLGDALGLDLYIDQPSTSYRFTSPDLRSVWKQQAISFWADQAKAQGKDVWLAEVQAQPWDGTVGYEPANLLATAVDYRQEPVQVVLLWGVETWLRDPAWMAAANHAMTILRT
jgi:hypothetical protein